MFQEVAQVFRATGQNFLSVFSKVTVTVLVLHHIAHTAAKLSGYYYDNGYQQTVIDTSLGLLEKEVMQEEILHLLGRLHVLWIFHDDHPNRPPYDLFLDFFLM